MKLLGAAFVIWAWLGCGGAYGACDVGLRLDPGRSEMKVSGEAEAGFLTGLRIVPKAKNLVSGVMGRLELGSPGECPGSKAGLGGFAEKGGLTGGKLELYPDGMVLAVGEGLADLTFQGVEMQLTSKKGFKQGKGNSWTGDFELEILSGIVIYEVSSTLGLDVAPGNSSLAGRVTTETLDMELELEGLQVVMDIPDAKFVFPVTFETGIDAIPEITVELIFEGSIFAEGAIGCKKCGENGKCVAGSNGKASCQCACGWAGKNCNTASGFCARFGENTTAIASLPATKTTPASAESKSQSKQKKLSGKALEKQCSELFSSRQCFDERSRYNINTQKCECLPNWSGKDCTMCESNDVCNSFLDKGGTTCSFDYDYAPHTALKQYRCDLSESSYKSFIGNSLSFQCDTKKLLEGREQAQNNPDGDVMGGTAVEDLIGKTASCTVNIQYLGRTPITCKAWGCDFSLGSSNVNCKTMACTCEGSCPSEVTSIASGFTSVSFVCDEDSRTCTVSLGGALALDVEAPCEARECYDSSGPKYVVAASGGKKWRLNWKVLAISVPTALVLFVILMLGFPAARLGYSIRKAHISTGFVAKRTTASYGIKQVEFHNLVCSVRVSPEAKAAADKGLLQVDEEQPNSEQYLNFKTSGLSPNVLSIMDSRMSHKSILHGISGTFNGGEVVGIMGPSGSGKSTFLSVVSSVTLDTSGSLDVSGRILVNGKVPGEWMQSLSAFVPQEDKLLPTLSVRESLVYSALLRLPGTSIKSISSRANSVMNELGLNAVQDSLVGGVRNMRGVSGGERRRVTIGMELITDPSLVIMDEPLSGLDSFTALNLMYTLKNIGSAGRLVVISLHQPTPEMINMLDQLLLLAKGFQIYLGKPQRAPQFFADRGFACPAGTSIAEYLLKTVSNNATLIPLLNAVHQDSEAPNNLEEIEAKPAVEASSLMSPSVRDLMQKRSTVSTLRVLTWRGVLDIVRNPSLLLSQNVMAIIMGLWCGLVFYNAKLDQNGAQNRLGGIFFLLAFLAFSSLTTIDLLHTERGIALREIKGGYYSSTTYVTAKLFLDAGLLRVLPAILYSVPLYLMMGMQQDLGKFGLYLFTVCTFNVVIGALSMAMTILAPSPGTASLGINTFLLISLLMMGHLVHLPSITSFVRWMHYCSPFSYAFYILAVNEMADLKLNFEIAGYASVGGISGSVFLRTVGLEEGKMKGSLIMLNVIYGIAIVAIYFAVWFTKSEGRRKRVKGYFNRVCKKIGFHSHAE